MIIPDWPTYFMQMCALVATKSKDPSTKIGTVIVGPANEIRSTGYNGPPRGLNDNDPTIYQRPKKYVYFAHSERNAIYNAARVGIPLENCLLYTLGVPCSGCAVAIINSGIKSVTVSTEWNKLIGDKWIEEALHTSIMFKQCGVIVNQWSGRLGNLVLINEIEYEI